MLCECAFGGSGELLSAVGGILAVFEKAILINVFHEWRKRFQKCIDTEGEDVKSSKRLIRITSIFIRGIVKCQGLRGTPQISCFSGNRAA
jgi:hypothetical protein